MTDLLLPFPWEQGEHMAIVGDTGSGKTFLAFGMDGKPGLLDYRKYSVALRAKGDDAKWTNSKRVFTALPAMKDPKLLKIELFPKRGHELREFKIALEEIYKQKKTAVYVDELYHATNLVKPIVPIIDDLLTRGRSLGITVVTGMQRPVKVSRFALSQSKHVICFRVEPRDAKTIREATTEEMEDIVGGLGRFQFAWFERVTRRIWTGSLQDLWG